MSSSYSPDLRFELISNGEQSGVWGNTTNNNIGTLVEQAIAGTASVTVTSVNQALSVYNGVSDESRNAIISLSTTTGAPFNVFVPPVSKLYVFVNTTSYAATAYASTVAGNTTAAGSGISLAANSKSFAYCDGTNVVDAINHISGNFFIEGILTLSSALVGNVTGNVTGNLTGNSTGTHSGAVALAGNTLTTTNFTVVESGGVLYFKNGATNIAKLDASGNLTVKGNVTAYGTI